MLNNNGKVWFGLFVHRFSHICNNGHISYRLQTIYMLFPDSTSEEAWLHGLDMMTMKNPQITVKLWPFRFCNIVKKIQVHWVMMPFQMVDI